VALKLLVPPPAAATWRASGCGARSRRSAGSPRQHRRGVRFPRRRPVELHRHGVRPRPDLQVRVGERGRLDADAAVRLVATWPPRSARPTGAASSTGRKAAERPARPRRPRAAHRLRLRQARRTARRHRQRHAGRHAGVHRAGSARRPPGDARADLYALGLTLYYALTGELPDRPSPHLPPTPDPWVPAPAGGTGRPGLAGRRVAHATAAAVEERFPTAAALDEALARPGAASELLVNGASGRCVLCNGPDPLALGLCPACGGSPEATDTLVFLRRGPTHRRGARRRSASRQCCRRSDARRPAWRREENGRCSASPAPACRGCSRRWIAGSCRPARFRSPERGRAARARLDPRRCGRHRGGVAGSVALPMLLWSSPLIATLVLLGAGRDARTPVVRHPGVPPGSRPLSSGPSSRRW